MMMAKCVTSLTLRHQADQTPELEPVWRIAHDVRNDLAAALMRLGILQRSHPSKEARAAVLLIRASLAQLDALDKDVETA